MDIYSSSFYGHLSRNSDYFNGEPYALFFLPFSKTSFLLRVMLHFSYIMPVLTEQGV